MNNTRQKINCTYLPTRMSLLTPPITHIGAVLFIIGSILAITANAICLIILCMPKRRSRSNKLLISLAISDVLVGFLVFPLNASQMISPFALRNKVIDSVRIYIAVFLEGSSVLTLAVIALDRYIMMTKMSWYNKKSIKYVTVVLVAFAWLFPATAPAVRWLDKDAYLIVLTIIFITPFFVLLVSYIFITRALQRQERKLRKQQTESFHFQEVRFHDGENKGNRQQQKDGDVGQVSDRAMKLKSQKNFIRITKAVSFLLLVYFFCITPKNAWMIVYLVDSNCTRIKVMNHQYLYLVAMIAVSYNSCFNPLIYFAKNPEIQKGFRKLFRIKKRTKSYDSQSTGISS